MWIPNRFFVVCLGLTTLNVIVDQAGTFCVTDGSIDTQIVIVGISPYLTGDGAIVGSPGGIGTTHMFFGLLSGVSVSFHDILYIESKIRITLS